MKTSKVDMFHIQISLRRRLCSFCSITVDFDNPEFDSLEAIRCRAQDYKSKDNK
jgi:hypothetical protein